MKSYRILPSSCNDHLPYFLESKRRHKKEVNMNNQQGGSYSQVAVEIMAVKEQEESRPSDAAKPLNEIKVRLFLLIW